MGTEKVWTLERVEELLAKCAEGSPWQRGGNYWDDKTITSYNGTAFVADCGNNLFTAQHAEFIAASPEIIKWLLDENAELKKKVCEALRTTI